MRLRTAAPLVIAYAAGMALHEVLSVLRDDVLARWKASVRGTLTPESTPHLELLDHLPQFLAEIVAALRDDAGLVSTGGTPEETNTAATHGKQRLRLGFSLDTVVREYGAMRNAIVASARDAGCEITFRELEVLSDCIVAGVAQAVTEYTLQRDAELLRHANEHFAFIAHELRNPLSASSIAFQLLKARGQLPTESRAVASLERGLARTNELVEQTLRLAQLAAGIELRRRPTSLRALCDDAELDAVGEAEEKGIEMRVVVTDANVNLDERLVRSALSNLVRNAVKYTKPGGSVELRASVTNGRATFEVEDGCGGLPPGMVEQAFAPFVRLDCSQTGFGLGLAISKQAADAHGGSIRVQNLPGHGCMFVLELPVG
jgi:signal transduction histidine kinase